MSAAHHCDDLLLTLIFSTQWPGIMLVFPFLGRIWCAICPFMAIGNLCQELVTGWNVRLRRWPASVREWGPAFAFGLFYAILMWEELWDLPQSGALSAWLLLLITAGVSGPRSILVRCSRFLTSPATLCSARAPLSPQAVIGSVTHEKRIWCRYMCPIGAMNKMFATAAMTEVRTWSANCEGCQDPTCFKGGSPALDPDDAYAIKGCTMGLKNNQLRDMGDCVMCMSCVKNCEREAPEFNLRPPGQDYGLPWFLPMQLQPAKHLPNSQVI